MRWIEKTFYKLLTGLRKCNLIVIVNVSEKKKNVKNSKKSYLQILGWIILLCHTFDLKPYLQCVDILEDQGIYVLKDFAY